MTAQKCRNRSFLFVWAVTLSLGALVITVAPNSSYGALAHLKDGRVIEGDIVELPDHYQVTQADGATGRLEKDRVLRIESKPGKASLTGLFAARWAEAQADTDACFELARWAETHNLLPSCVLAIRAVLHLNPQHAQAQALLRKYQLRADRLGFNDSAATELLDHMGTTFHLLRTQHYRICYNSSFVFAEVVGERLEQVYEQFILFFEDRSFRPAPITDRLEVILFDSQKDFHAYAQRNMPAMADSSGFYSTADDRAYFFDAVNDGSYRRQALKMAAAKKDLLRLHAEVQAAPQGTRYVVQSSDDAPKRTLEREEMFDELRRQRQLLEDEQNRLKDAYRTLNVNLTVHEATHQLAYSAGVHSRYYDTPKWLIEGLAVYFEAAANGSWSGPGQLHPQRIKTMTASQARPLPLTKLLSADQLFEPGGASTDCAYAHAWALFYFLAHRHHEALFDYMYELSLRIDQQDYPAALRRSDFERHFGNIAAVQRQWRRFMADIPN